MGKLFIQAKIIYFSSNNVRFNRIISVQDTLNIIKKVLYESSGVEPRNHIRKWESFSRVPNLTGKKHYDKYQKILLFGP